MADNKSCVKKNVIIFRKRWIYNLFYKNNDDQSVILAQAGKVHQSSEFPLLEWVGDLPIQQEVGDQIPSIKKIHDSSHLCDSLDFLRSPVCTGMTDFFDLTWKSKIIRFLSFKKFFKSLVSPRERNKWWWGGNCNESSMSKQSSHPRYTLGPWYIRQIFTPIIKVYIENISR